MKKILLLCLLLILAVVLCSCNSNKQESSSEDTTILVVENVTDSESDEVDSLNHEESTENKLDESDSLNCEGSTEEQTYVVLQKLVYTNMSLDNVFVQNNNVIVVNIPDEFKLGESISETPINITPEKKVFTFGGVTYNLTLKLGKTKKLFEATNGKVDDLDYHVYRDGDSRFNFVKGTDKLIQVLLTNYMQTDTDKEIISIEKAESIALDFMQKYSLATSLDDLKVNCSEMDTIRISYQLTIGGYDVYGENYVVCLNKNGDICMYSDNTSGLYSEFVDKVTEADVNDAKERLYPYHMDGAYGYADPYLKVANDGNLYLCSAYFVDEEVDGTTIAREYMFYSRVYYEE